MSHAGEPCTALMIGNTPEILLSHRHKRMQANPDKLALRLCVAARLPASSRAPHWQSLGKGPPYGV